MAKRKESGFQGRKRWRGIERILSLLPEHEAAGLREQMRRELASREGKTKRVTAREEALTRYLAWIGEPEHSAARIIADLCNSRPLWFWECQDDDPIGQELREALKLALQRSVAKAPGLSLDLGEVALRRDIQNTHREVWGRKRLNRTRRL